MAFDVSTCKTCNLTNLWCSKKYSIEDNNNEESIEIIKDLDEKERNNNINLCEYCNHFKKDHLSPIINNSYSTIIHPSKNKAIELNNHDPQVSIFQKNLSTLFDKFKTIRDDFIKNKNKLNNKKMACKFLSKMDKTDLLFGKTIISAINVTLNTAILLALKNVTISYLDKYNLINSVVIDIIIDPNLYGRRLTLPLRICQDLKMNNFYQYHNYDLFSFDSVNMQFKMDDNYTDVSKSLFVIIPLANSDTYSVLETNQSDIVRVTMTKKLNDFFEVNNIKDNFCKTIQKVKFDSLNYNLCGGIGLNGLEKFGFKINKDYSKLILLSNKK